MVFDPLVEWEAPGAPRVHAETWLVHAGMARSGRLVRLNGGDYTYMGMEASAACLGCDGRVSRGSDYWEESVFNAGDIVGLRGRGAWW